MHFLEPESGDSPRVRRRAVRNQVNGPKRPRCWLNPALWALMSLVPLAPGCESNASSAELTRELSQVREELAAQRARTDGIVDRLERMENILASEEDDIDDSPDSFDTPPVESATLVPQGGVPDAPTLIVAVAKRTLTIGEQKLDKSALADRFSAHVARNPQAAVMLRVASGVSSGRMTEIADIAKEQGITQIAVVREGTAKKKKKRRKRRR